MTHLLPSVSVRLKLTLLYGGLFLVAGAGLLAVNYALVNSQFTLPFETSVDRERRLASQLPELAAAGAPDVLFVQALPDGRRVTFRAPDRRPCRRSGASSRPRPSTSSWPSRASPWP